VSRFYRSYIDRVLKDGGASGDDPSTAGYNEAYNKAKNKASEIMGITFTVSGIATCILLHMYYSLINYCYTE